MFSLLQHVNSNGTHFPCTHFTLNEYTDVADGKKSNTHNNQNTMLSQFHHFSTVSICRFIMKNDTFCSCAVRRMLRVYDMRMLRIHDTAEFFCLALVVCCSFARAVLPFAVWFGCAYSITFAFCLYIHIRTTTITISLWLSVIVCQATFRCFVRRFCSRESGLICPSLGCRECAHSEHEHETRHRSARARARYVQLTAVRTAQVGGGDDD